MTQAVSGYKSVHCTIAINGHSRVIAHRYSIVYDGIRYSLDLKTRIKIISMYYLLCAKCGKRLKFDVVKCDRGVCM